MVLHTRSVAVYNLVKCLMACSLLPFTADYWSITFTISIYLLNKTVHYWHKPIASGESDFTETSDVFSTHLAVVKRPD